MINLYSTPTCGNCKILKQKLQIEKIDFTVIEDEKILKEKGIMTVPVLEIIEGSETISMSFYNAIKWLKNKKEEQNGN